MYVVIYRDGKRGRWGAIMELYRDWSTANFWVDHHPVKGREYRIRYVEIDE